MESELRYLRHRAGVCRLRDYSALRASPFGPPSADLRRSTWPDGQVVEPLLFMSGVRPRDKSAPNGDRSIFV